MDMRHRSTPVQTCQRYALRCDRVNSAERAYLLGETGKPDTGWERFSTDTPLLWTIGADTCGQRC